MLKKPAFLGIDLGTTGIRAVLCDEKGRVIGTSAAGIEKSFLESADPRVSEQDPGQWEPVLLDVLKKTLSHTASYNLMAVCCDSTSGTIIPVDLHYSPVYCAILHNDTRAEEESAYINEAAGITVKPSFALSKILWIMRNREDVWRKTYRFIHAADYVKGLVSGDFEPTDFSNAVKTGYDLVGERWPDEIERVLGIPLDRLPRVVRTGTVAGEMKAELLSELGIKSGVSVIAGATDSTTGFYSSGARTPGNWNTTLGTVLGIKGIAREFIKDPDGLLYAHRHPEGLWLPGAASSTGGEALRALFGEKLSEYDRRIAGMPPTRSIIYPLVRKGEKLPFFNNDATGFIKAPFCDPAHLFKGVLEGLCYVERMVYEKIERLGYQVGDTLFSMGGGTNSAEWMRIRASVLHRTVKKATVTETAFGSCVIAAGGSYYNGLSDAIEHMVGVESSIEPDSEEQKVYEEAYHEFVSECRTRDLFGSSQI
jgi:sugar (pentulose or hexulose) kinase